MERGGAFVSLVFVESSEGTVWEGSREMHWGFRVIHQLGHGISLRKRSKVLTPDFGSGVSRIPLNRSSVEFPFVMAVDEGWEGYHTQGQMPMQLRFFGSLLEQRFSWSAINPERPRRYYSKAPTKLDNCARFAQPIPPPGSYSLIIAKI